MMDKEISLDLIICEELVKQFNGCMTLASVENKGTLFAFSILLPDKQPNAKSPFSKLVSKVD